MGTLLVVTGPPGSGKSTVSKLLARRAGPSALIEGDQFFAFLERDAIDPWLPESHEQNTVVVSAAASATGRFTEGGFFTVYDGVIGQWFLDTFGSATGLTELDYVVQRQRHGMGGLSRSQRERPWSHSRRRHRLHPVSEPALRIEMSRNRQR